MSAQPKYHLSGGMAFIADIVGDEVAFALIETLPGIEVKIPETWSEDSILAMLDRDIADILIEKLPGDTLYVPNIKPKKYVDAREDAMRLRSEGKSNTEIALTLGVTERYVRSILNAVPRLSHVDTRQIDMFPKSDDD